MQTMVFFLLWHLGAGEMQTVGGGGDVEVGVDDDDDG